MGQRRFFVLYELGTLNWALDDEAGTDPAGALDLNKPYSITKADEETHLTNTICIQSCTHPDEKTIIRTESREDSIFWYSSLNKMIADSKERQKQVARRNKMLALRRRHHTVSSTQSQSNAIEEAKKMNSARDKQRCQTIDNSASVSSSIFQATSIRRERPQSLITHSTTSIPSTPSAPSTPTTSEMKPPLAPKEEEYSRAGRNIRRNHSAKVESTSYQSKATSSSLVPARSSSVDRRSTYGQRDRLNSYEQVMRGSTSAATASSEKKHITPFRQSWLQVVEATNIKGAPVQSRRLWFTVLPGKLTAYSGASTQSDAEFVLRLSSKVTIKEVEQEPTSRYHQLIVSNLANNGTLVIGSLTEKIRQLWLDSIQMAIEQSTSRSSSISSNEPTDITNKIERIPTQKPPTPSSSLSTTTQSTSAIMADINAENAEPTLKTRRRKKRDERPKTIDFGCLNSREQIMQSLKSNEQKQLKSPAKPAKEGDIWDRIGHTEPKPIEDASTGSTRDIEDELERTKRELERVKRENEEKAELLNKARLEKLATRSSVEDGKLRSIAYSNDSCDNEIFSTPPSSPQPQINIQKSTQANTPNSDRHQSEQRKTREESFKRELEEELQRQREKTEKAASSLTTAQTEIERQKAELAELRSRLTQSQSQAEHERKRCDEEQRAAERMRLSNDELRGEIKKERSLFDEMRNDLKIAIQSISARGPFINMDMPLNDLESRILKNIRPEF